MIKRTIGDRMNKKSISTFLVILGLMFISSAILLFLLSFFIWKADAGASVVGASVIFVYIVACLIGGYLMGKKMGKQKFFWGIVTGVAYFLLLLIVGVAFMGTNFDDKHQLISGAMICTISGMLGGMIAPSVK